MAEVKPDEKSNKRKNPMLKDKDSKTEEQSLDDVMSGRKRRASFESKDSKGRSSSRTKSGRDSPADESLTGRSESYYGGENASMNSEDQKRFGHDDHESIASVKGDDHSLVGDANAEKTVSLKVEEENKITPGFETTDGGDQEGGGQNEADVEGDGDADGEADGGDGENIVRSSKKKRKRTSSILRSLEPINGEELPTMVFSEEDGLPRYQSSRAAAMVAKTKMSAKGSSGKLNASDDPLVAGDMPTSTPRRRKNEASAASQLNWVQCDKCSKWRSVAHHVNNEELPDEWFCSMNTWDFHLNNCDAPEEEEPVQTTATLGRPRGSGRAGAAATAEEGQDGDETAEGGHRVEGPRAKTGGRGGGRGRWRRNIEETVVDNGDEEGDDDFTMGGAQNRKRGYGAAGTPRPGSLSRGTSAGTQNATGSGEAAAENWAQCDKCRKWRKVPATVDVESLPKRWYCVYNTWNPSVARCSAKQEVDDVATTGGEAGAVGGRGMNRGRRPQGSNANFAASAFSPPGTVKQVSWVQCERRNCKKWRKVPGHIDMETFPEKWYCEMNTWDIDAASCDAPEASDSENELPGGAASRQQLILANSKGANALSYRRIIFGTDGRIRPCFSDKNKNGYGIFSYSETHKPSNDADDYTAPTRRVGYWWSGAYDECAGIAAAQNAHNAGGRANSKKLAAAALAEATAAETVAQDKLLRFEPPAPTYLLDTARRIFGMQCKPLTFTWPKKICKSYGILRDMTLFRRQNLECTVVMSSFMAASASQLLFTKLLSLVFSSRFSDPEVEACRAYMSSDALKAAVKRLEDRGLVEVSYASAGQLSVEVLPPVAQLTQNASVRGPLSVSATTGISPAWAKQGIPLKLRKFYGDSKYKTDTTSNNGQEATEETDTGSIQNTLSNNESKAYSSSEKQQQQELNESLANVTVSPVPTKPFRLQHHQKWPSIQG